MIGPTRPPGGGAASGGPARSGDGPVEIRVLGTRDGRLWRVLAEGGERDVLIRKGAHPGEVLRGFFDLRKTPPEFIPQRETGQAAGRFPGSLPPLTAEETARQTILRLLLGGQTTPGPEKIEKLLELSRSPSPAEARKRAALAARCELKGLSPGIEDFDFLYALLEGGHREKDRNRRERGERGQETEAPPIPTHGEESPLLLLFNHLPEGEKTWIIVPYTCTVAGVDYAGSLRLRYDRARGKTEAAVLSVRPGNLPGNAPGEGVWYFLWTVGGGLLRMIVPGESPEAGAQCAELGRKIRKHGLELDDIPYNEDCFDGFDFGRERLHFVDEVV